MRVASVPIDHVLICPEAPVPEGGGPERTYVAAGILCDGDAHCLHLGGVGLQLQRPSRGRDPAGQLDITLAQGSVLSGAGTDGHAFGTQVHVREVAHGVANLGDRGDESGAL